MRTRHPIDAASAEIFNPAMGTVSPTGSMTAVRRDPGWISYSHTYPGRTLCLTLLADGRVLVTGGDTAAELYDPLSGTFSRTGSMAELRTGHTATLLADGTVLIAGGADGQTGQPLATAEIYDPATGAFRPVGRR